MVTDAPKPCYCSACYEPMRFVLRLVAAMRSPPIPGVAITLSPCQAQALTAKYRGVPEEGLRNFLIGASALGVGGAA